MSPTIREQIRQFIAHNFMFADNVDGLADDASLLEEGIVDSTGVLELVGFIEETFDLHVEDDEIVPDHLDSVDRLAEFVRRKQAA